MPADVCQPMGWEELEACVASGLITLGSHSHRHLKGRDCAWDNLVEEAERSREVLLRAFGEVHARYYAYPYGCRQLGFASPAYASAVRAAGYEGAVTVNADLASLDSDPYLLPRVEVHALDGPAVLRAKVQGTLTPFYLLESLRSARRGV
jgi:peptidoglycan/xylan/chitin deacetylase (PgdA/CDA1 family)